MKSSRDKVRARERRERTRNWTNESQRNGNPVKPLLECKMKEIAQFCRVSTGEQNVKSQARGNRKLVQNQGFKVIKTVAAVETGKGLDENVRKKFFGLVNWCCKEGVPLNVPGITRALRHPDFHATRNSAVQPDEEMWKRFVEKTKGVNVYSTNDPHASNDEDEAFLASLSESNGRPKKYKLGHKKRQREANRKEARRLHKEGLKIAGISRQLNIPRSTVIDWIKK